MSNSDEDFWRRFDELNGQRVRLSKRREEALRRLNPSTARSEDPEAVAAWTQYCESVEGLDRSIAELERLIWQID